jgi:hypothetical protein
MMSYSEFSDRYNTADLLKIIAALQIIPQNHGKNYRLENLTRIAATNYNDSKHPVPIAELEQILLDEYSESEQEDRPVNLFTENAVFSGGNYIVFPGIFEGGAALLNNLLFSTFFSKDNGIPKTFIEQVKPQVWLLLRLSNYVAEQAGLERNIYEKRITKLIEVPLSQQLDNLVGTVTFSKLWLLDRCAQWGLKIESISSFVVDFNDPDLGDHSLLSPFQKHPLALIGDEYILAQPTSCVEALVTFIWEEAQKHGCYDAVRKSLMEWQWEGVHQLCFQTQWRPLDLEMPAPSTGLPLKDGLYFVDLNKIAYVCFVETGKKYVREDIDYSEMNNPPEEVQILSELIHKRQDEVYIHLESKFEKGTFEILVLYIVSEVGFPQLVSFPNPSQSRPMLWFRFTEFKRIVQFEESDPLLLWKFAKCYAEVFDKCELVSLGGLLDMYVYYRFNQSTLWPLDEERPKIMKFIPGMAASYSRGAIIKHDEHLAPFIVDSSLVHVPVYNYYEHAPLYKHANDTSPAPIFLEGFVVPVWLFNDQVDTHPHQLISMHLEMIAFWLLKMGNEVEKYFASYDLNTPLRINVSFDKRYINEIRPNEVPRLALEEIDLKIQGSYPIISLTIPFELANWYSRPDNTAERFIMQKLLSALIPVDTDGGTGLNILEIIDHAIPFGRAKMVTMLGANNFTLETRNLPPYRPLQQYDTTFFQLNLTRQFDLSIDAKDFDSATAKRNLCNRISNALREFVTAKLKSFRSHDLLLMLLSLHEACIQKRAIQVLDQPGRKATLGDYEHRIASLAAEEQVRIKTALSLRCLIELVVAFDPVDGEKFPNFDEVDELMAAMNEWVTWGMLSDGIHLGLYNPGMTLLASGKIEVDYEEINSAFFTFTKSRTQNEDFQFDENYDDLYEFASVDSETEKSKNVLEVEEAFIQDFGLSLLRIHDLVCDLVNLVRRANKSIICIEESDLIGELKKTKHAWTEEQIISVLKLLTLESGWDVGHPPSGYEDKETFPWRYRRALSFVRKPIAKLVQNNVTLYYWSYRNLFASIDNTVNMLYEGTLWIHGANNVNALVKKMRDRKGKIFRNQVVEWLQRNSSLEVIAYEVSMESGGKIETPEDLGDIDILAIDHKSKIIYFIECKNSVDSRAPFEMKTEIDKYLGKKKGEGWIQKHLKRYEWLKANKSVLKLFGSKITEYELKAPVVTSEEIPLPYMRKDLPLTLISFPRLKALGVEILEKCL